MKGDHEIVQPPPGTRKEDTKVKRSRRILHRERFADPWSFREQYRVREGVADLFGGAAEVSDYRRGGAWIRFPIRLDPTSPASHSRPERSMLVELRRRVAAEISRYRTSGLFSAKEIELIEALWNGMSLREFARRKGVSAAAIEDRIVRLRTRAVRFYNWWRWKNRSRIRR